MENTEVSDRNTSQKKYNINIDTEKYTQLRRQFHKIPEVGYKEYKTKSLIIETLKSFPDFNKHAKIIEIGETGFYFDIYGKKGDINTDSKSPLLISLRADIDGLPFHEISDLDYKSQHEGMIHGCGHDGHITILLSTVDYYLKNLDKVPLNFGVRFLFQPAEEGLRGAVEMIKGGCLNGVSEIYGLHNLTQFKVGEIGVIPGTIMSSGQTFEIIIKGKGGHSSTPHKCHSPINTGAQIVTALNKIISQEIDSNDRNVISVCYFQSGDTFNVIPETAVIKGTMRSVNFDSSIKIINRIREISETICKLNSSEVTVNHYIPSLCTVNHKEPTELIEKIASKYFSIQTHDLPVMASEDFSFYTDAIPGCFFLLGVGDETHKEYLHTPNYDFNDKGIPYGVEMFIRIIAENANATLI